MLLKQLIENGMNTIKETVNKYKFVKQMNKLLEKAKDVAPLKFWINKEFFTPSARWELVKTHIDTIVLTITQDDIKIEAHWDNGMWYNNPAFYSEEEARNLCKDVAGIYINSLLEDKKYYEEALQRCNEAIAMARDENGKPIDIEEKKEVECEKECKKKCTKKCTWECKKECKSKKTTKK